MKITPGELFLGVMAFIFALLVLGGIISLVRLAASRIRTLLRIIKFKLKEPFWFRDFIFLPINAKRCIMTQNPGKVKSFLKNCVGRKRQKRWSFKVLIIILNYRIWHNNESAIVKRKKLNVKRM